MSRFQLSGLPASVFSHLGGLDDQALAARGIRRVIADSNPGYPCRVSLVDAEVGEALYLLSHTHHAVDSPYRASGPVFVRVGARTATLAPGEVPLCVTSRLMSARAYDTDHMMVAAQVIEGARVAQTLESLFDRPEILYVQLHNAGPGCFSCEARRPASPRGGPHPIQ